MRDLIRTCIFRPYRKGMGPYFTLRLYDTGTSDHLGKCRLAYDLRQSSISNGFPPSILFDGSDFCCSPLHAIDSDDCIKSLMGFLCLRKGDTDSEYFKDYTPAQLEFSETYAEALGMEVHSRFGGKD